MAGGDVQMSVHPDGICRDHPSAALVIPNRSSTAAAWRLYSRLLK
jgi:hypothetical protein